MSCADGRHKGKSEGEGECGGVCVDRTSGAGELAVIMNWGALTVPRCGRGLRHQANVWHPDLAPSLLVSARPAPASCPPGPGCPGARIVVASADVAFSEAEATPMGTSRLRTVSCLYTAPGTSPHLSCALWTLSDGAPDAHDAAFACTRAAAALSSRTHRRVGASGPGWQLASCMK